MAGLQIVWQCGSSPSASQCKQKAFLLAHLTLKNKYSSPAYDESLSECWGDAISRQIQLFLSQNLHSRAEVLSWPATQLHRPSKVGRESSPGALIYFPQSRRPCHLPLPCLEMTMQSSQMKGTGILPYCGRSKLRSRSPPRTDPPRQLIAQPWEATHLHTPGLPPPGGSDRSSGFCPLLHAEWVTGGRSYWGVRAALALGISELGARKCHFWVILPGTERADLVALCERSAN